VEHILAIELLCAAQGIDFRGPDKLGKGTKAAYSMIRKRVSTLKEDRVMSKDIEATVELIRSQQLVNAVIEAVKSALD
jgi:histidine ammonia-lyase